jgi:hypothetical protein
MYSELPMIQPLEFERAMTKSGRDFQEFSFTENWSTFATVLRIPDSV